MAVKEPEAKGKQYALPDAATLERAYQLNVLDQHGNEHSFKSLATAPEGTKRRVIVFIRHFFCGFCEHYVHALTQTLPPSRLASASTDLIIIGCGQPGLIQDYAKRTQCPYPIYADPNRKIYACLDMVINLAMGDTKPDYVTTSVFSTTMSSALNGLKSGTRALGGGKINQNGGEWIFEEGRPTWCRRMQNTTDHAEMPELTAALNLQQD